MSPGVQLWGEGPDRRISSIWEALVHPPGSCITVLNALSLVCGLPRLQLATATTLVGPTRQSGLEVRFEPRLNLIGPLMFFDEM